MKQTENVVQLGEKGPADKVLEGFFKRTGDPGALLAQACHLEAEGLK